MEPVVTIFRNCTAPVTLMIIAWPHQCNDSLMTSSHTTSQFSAHLDHDLRSISRLPTRLVTSLAMRQSLNRRTGKMEPCQKIAKNTQGIGQR
jgi:hypothetical protein